MSDGASSPTSPPHAADRQITLQVGERRFITTRETLVAESGFFAALLSGCWDDVQEDGSYFIDADPNLFEHILRYLRRAVFPLFYDLAKGHNHALYLALLGEARYFQIPRLQNWLENKDYFHAIKVQCTVETQEDIKFLSTTLPTSVDVEYYPGWGTKKVYVCPRGVFVHRGRPESCGKSCMKAQGDADAVYDDEPCPKAVIVKKEVLLDMQSLLRGSPSPS
jgi:BTB/POZ domain-containing protein KCTD9